MGPRRKGFWGLAEAGFAQSEKRPERGALQACLAWSLHKAGPVLGCKGGEVRPGGGSKTAQEGKELCAHTLRKSGCSLYTQRPPDSPSDCTVFFTFLSPGKNYFENPL